MRVLRRIALIAVVCGAGVARAGEAPTPACPKAGYVGAELVPAYYLDADDRMRLRLEPGSGIVALHIVKGGPADLAGLRYGDVLVRFAGRDVPRSEPPPDLDDLGARLAGHERWLGAFRGLGIHVKAGDAVEVTVKRDGEPLALRMAAVEERALLPSLEAVAVARYPDIRIAVREGALPPRPRGFAGIGMQPVGHLSPGWRSLLGKLPEDGVVVVRVSPGSPAAVVGVRRGDLVKRYRGKAVPGSKDLSVPSLSDVLDGENRRRWKEALDGLAEGQLAGDEVIVEVERAGKRLEFALSLVDLTTLERTSHVAGEGNRF